MFYPHFFKRICQVMLLALTSAFSLHAAPAAGENMVVNPFRQELIQFDGITIGAHDGRNGTAALILSTPEWKDRSDYKTYSFPVEGVRPLGKYRFGAWIKTKDVVAGYRGATLTVHFKDENGRYNDGDCPYPYGFVGTKDEWTLLEWEVTAPSKPFHKVEICCYIGFEGTGTAIFSDPFFIPDVPVWKTGIIYPAMRYAVEPGKHTFEFNSYVQNIGADQEKQANVIFVNEDGNAVFEETVDIKDHRYQVTVDLPEGKYTAKLTLLPANLKTELSVNAVAPRDYSQVRIDERGRFFVNGKPFLPVAVYTNMGWPEFKPYGNRWRQYDTDTIINSPFNTVLPYDGLGWKLEDPDLSGADALRHMLDVFAEHDKKIIINIKDFRPDSVKTWENIEGPENCTLAVVDTFSEHPALLAWYINDEHEVRDYELKQVDLVGQADPYHPTIQCQYRENLQFSALNGGDIIGLDIYPIRKEDSDQKLVRDVFQSHQDTFRTSHGNAVCAIPQIFSWHAFSANIFKYMPTVQQMRSVTLMMAAYGAKSFLFFAHHGMVKMVKPFGVEFEVLWKDACQVAQTVRDIENYLLSDHEFTDPKLEIISGEPMVKLMQDNDGRQALIVTTVGTGKTDVIIQLDPERSYRSHYGTSKDLGSGRWQFTCEYLDCDIIEEIK